LRDSDAVAVAAALFSTSRCCLLRCNASSVNAGFARSFHGLSLSPATFHFRGDLRSIDNFDTQILSLGGSKVFAVTSHRCRVLPSRNVRNYRLKTLCTSPTRQPLVWCASFPRSPHTLLTTPVAKWVAKQTLLGLIHFTHFVEESSFCVHAYLRLPQLCPVCPYGTSTSARGAHLASAHQTTCGVLVIWIAVLAAGSLSSLITNVH
jgi:hypothetical protein